ncbi:carbonic anhydrase 2 [Kockovaella imperatae]|uniref:Carbonic anhydrase n=1 Tax=Kockovaella imperatae TaxID=4999 RepID=A0A1Y1UDU5_9TREE|nr:carbonic anhydrase 2 [Kockovaella imperatae]ORX35686.1 carbonic anhydrase 2 [Kockovaella imperatae]
MSGSSLSTSYPEVKALLESNQKWAASVEEQEKGFFENSAKAQYPKFLWFGCGDSRVPESTLMAQKPGSVFVHRNIANQFQPNDSSANAILEFAVGTVGVDHILVVGHSECGGCIAAHKMSPPTKDSPAPSSNSPLMSFLGPVIELRHSLKEGSTVDDLIAENVKMSVKNIVASPVIQSSWEKHAKGEMRPVYVHGWTYDLSTGLLKDLEVSQGPSQ